EWNRKMRFVPRQNRNVQVGSRPVGCCPVDQHGTTDRILDDLGIALIGRPVQRDQAAGWADRLYRNLKLTAVWRQEIEVKVDCFPVEIDQREKTFPASSIENDRHRAVVWPDAGVLVQLADGCLDS